MVKKHASSDDVISRLNKINGHYKNQDCKPYHDYREMMARKDIDAVMLAVPDHWHALTAVQARMIGDKGAYASVGAKVLERAAVVGLEEIKAAYARVMADAGRPVV